MSTRSQASSKSSSKSVSPSTTSSSSHVPNRIAEDLLRLLRGSVVSTTPTKSMVSTASTAQSNLSSGFLSQIELAILRSVNPVDVTETEEITVLGQRGVWMNRAEVIGWKGRIRCLLVLKILLKLSLN